MSDEAPPSDQLDVKLVWRDGFDVRMTINKGSLRYRSARWSLFWLVVFVVLIASVPVLEMRILVGVSLIPVIGFAFRSRACWRLRGNARQFTISKTLGKLGWGRRDFMWAEIRGFGTSIEANGVADVLVQTRLDNHALNFELSSDGAEELAGALTKMRIRAKMDTLARSGYRGARLKQGAIQEERTVSMLILAVEG